MSGKLKLKTDNLDWVKASEETVILDDASEQYFATNPTGSLLWNALETGTTREELANLLVDTYQIDRAQAKADVEAYVAQLTDLDLLEEQS